MKFRFIPLLAIIACYFVAVDSAAAATYTAGNCAELQTAADNATTSIDIVELTANIDNDCAAVFGSSTPFSGTFDGDGYTITLSVTGTPLFNIVEGATIQNLTVDGTVALGGVDPYGPLGRYVAAVVFDTVTSSVNIVSIDGGSQYEIGGFVGRVTDSGADEFVIRNSAFNGSITIVDTDETYWGIGGLIGGVDDTFDEPLYVTSTVISGTISIVAGDVFGIGSVVGMLGSFGEGFAEVGTGMWIEDVVSSLDIDIETSETGFLVGTAGVGGLSGFSSTGDAFVIVSSEYSGDITVSSTDSAIWIGGAVGFHWSDGDTLYMGDGTTVSGNILIEDAGNETVAAGIGGLVGNFTSTDISFEDVAWSGTITSHAPGENTSIGGIVGEFVGEFLDGFLDEPVAMTMADIVSTGDITVSSPSSSADIYAIGGVVGLQHFATGTYTLVTSTVDITVSTTFSEAYFIGGVVGRIMLEDVSGGDTSFLETSYSGDINITTNDVYEVGGIIGSAYGVSNLEIESVTSDGTITLSTDEDDPDALFIAGVMAYMEGSSTSTLSVEQTSSEMDIVVSFTSSTADLSDFGGILGEVDGPILTSFFENYYNGSITINAVDADLADMGGLISEYIGESITVSSSYAIVDIDITITGEEYDDIDYIGGLFGDLDYATATIRNVFAAGSISIDASEPAAGDDGTEQIGGLIGSGESNGLLTLVYAYADVDITIETGDNEPVEQIGGLIGDTQGGDTVIRNSFAAGAIEITSDETPIEIGGLLGNPSGHDVTNSYFDIYRTGQTECSTTTTVGGCTGVNEFNYVATTGYFVNNETNDPLDTWNFDDVWETQDDYYPVLAFAPYDGSVTLGTEEGEEEQSSGGGTYVPPTPPRTVNSALESLEMDEDGARVSGAFTINSSAAETNNRTVTLTFTDIENTAQVAVSESPTFAGASYQPFADTLSYTLSTGNGTKTVYAKLRSSEGATLVLKDTIVLTGTVETPTPGTTETPIDPTQALQCTSNVYLTNPVKLGANNNPTDVRLLEEFLNTYENANLPVNGIYEQADFNAVVAWQEKYAADVLVPWGITNGTGYVFTSSLAKIKQIHEANCATATQPTLPPTTPNNTPTACLETTQTLTLGMNNTLVATAQRLLKKLGYFPADIDATGYFGSITRTATVDFQAANQIDQLGIIGPQTRARLNELGC